jgi:uncharacterized protein (DUF2141 family)
LSVHLGNGDGTFQAAQASGNANGGLPAVLAVGDLNGDGKLNRSTKDWHSEVLL